jgi:L-threonylcarbamoyladenylate synthase
MWQKNLKNVQFLENNGVILAETDTVYGLLCNAESTIAIERLINIKKRTNPVLAVFVSDIDMAKKYAVINNKQEVIFNAIFPGYFTLILEVNSHGLATLDNRIFGINKNNKKTIGIRIPKNQNCISLVKEFQKPLVATSANISKVQSASAKLEDVSYEIISQVDSVNFEHNQTIGLNSTIVDISDENEMHIIRHGSGDMNLIYNVLKN